MIFYRFDLQEIDTGKKHEMWTHTMRIAEARERPFRLRTSLLPRFRRSKFMLALAPLPGKPDKS